MKLLATSFVAVASLCAVAHADASVTDQDAAEQATSDGRAEITGGVMGGATYAALDAAVTVEGTYRIAPALPFYVRGRAAMGNADQLDFSDDGGGSKSSPMLQVLGGIELRGCVGGGIVCPLVGVNAGYESQGSLGNSMLTYAGALGGGDVGLDVGGDTIRARIVLDIFDHYDNARLAGGGDLSIGVGARF